MADRAPQPRAPNQQQPTTAIGGALTRPRTTSQATSSSTLASNVRRNLFQGNLTRRPTGGSASTSTETLRLDAGSAGGGDEEAPESSDIVVRDRNGEVQLGDPPLPVVEDPEEVAPDARQENESTSSLTWWRVQPGLFLCWGGHWVKLEADSSVCK